MVRLIAKRVARFDPIISVEGIGEIVNVTEITQAVVWGFPHFAAFYQLEDDVPEVSGRSNTPVLEHRIGQQTEFFDREIANAFEHLRSGNMRFVFFGVVGGQAIQQPLGMP